MTTATFHGALAELGDGLDGLPAGPPLRRLEADARGPFRPLDVLRRLPRAFPWPRCLLGADFGGVGEALDTSFAEAAALPDRAGRAALLGWPADEAARFTFGLSLRFDVAAPAEPGWAPFGRGRLWLPLLELDGAAGRVALNLPPGDRARQEARRLLQVLAGLPEGAGGEAPAVVPDWRPDPQARPRWTAGVRAALSALGESDGPGKLVLARRLDGRVEEALRAADLLAREADPAGWPWWIERGGVHWLGVSPEPLGRRDGRRLRTLALAGTRARRAGSDEEAGAGLLASEKDRREHEAVAGWLRARLQGLGDGPVEEGPLELEALPGLLHLKRRLEVNLRTEVEDGDWLAALHPTPALGGAPRHVALAWLRDHEGFDRGLYGGVVGRLSAERGELRVAIRGLRLAGERLALYAGAGLVAGSEPDPEWEETRAKLGAIARRFGLPPLPEDA